MHLIFLELACLIWITYCFRKNGWSSWNVPSGRFPWPFPFTTGGWDFRSEKHWHLLYLNNQTRMKWSYLSRQRNRNPSANTTLIKSWHFSHYRHPGQCQRQTLLLEEIWSLTVHTFSVTLYILARWFSDYNWIRKENYLEFTQVLWEPAKNEIFKGFWKKSIVAAFIWSQIR